MKSVWAVVWACGPDGICIRIFKLAFDTIGLILLHIVNACLCRGDIPSSWKHAVVHPIFKSGSSDDPSNYRPISILPVVAKIVEKSVQRQLQHYLSDNSLLSPAQHGFRPRHSTETALLNISDRVLSAMNKKQISILCLIDLSKCFDVISHSKLISKLQLHCIDTTWFENYLSGHTQSVSFYNSSNTNQLSAQRPINQGVFQGSSLGPLLFTIFANDLCLHTADESVIQYADDTQILVSGPKSSLSDLVARLESSLTSLDIYFRSNGLKVNESKFEVLPLGTRQNLRDLPSFVVKFREVTLTPCTEAKNLGVTFDRHMTWDTHVSQLSQKCIGILTGLSHLRHYLPPAIIPTIVSSLVFSHIRYCLTVYGNGSAKNTAVVQQILNFAARVISGKRKFDSISAVIDKLGWLSARDMHRGQTLTTLHRTRASGEPESLATLFCKNSERPDRTKSTRQDNLLSLPSASSNSGFRQFSYRAASEYNDLPTEFKQMSIPVFKRQLTKRLILAARAARAAAGMT